MDFKVRRRLGCNRNRMPLLSKASNTIQNIFYVYNVTDFTQLWHSIPVTTKCKPASYFVREKSKVLGGSPSTTLKISRDEIYKHRPRSWTQP